MSKRTVIKIQRFCLKKKMPETLWLRSVSAIQFDGSFACIRLIAGALNVQAKMDRHDHNKAQCRIPTSGPFYILVKKGEWVVWNKSILPLKKDILAGDLIWPDELFCTAYRKGRGKKNKDD